LTSFTGRGVEFTVEAVVDALGDGVIDLAIEETQRVCPPMPIPSRNFIKPQNLSIMHGFLFYFTAGLSHRPR
jgi:hypothetical protein